MITIDSIIRSYIHRRGLVWHDYFRLLTLAISGVKDLAMDIDIGTNIKAIEIDVDDTGNIDLPEDLVQIISLNTSLYDKIYPLSKSININPLIKHEDGDPVKRGNDYTEYRNGYGAVGQSIYSYERFGTRAQLDSALNLSCIVVIYTTTGISVTSANMIHPYAEDAVVLWMDKEGGGQKGIWEKQNERRTYYQAKRSLYGRLHGMSSADYIKTIRDYQSFGAKL